MGTPMNKMAKIDPQRITDFEYLRAHSAGLLREMMERVSTQKELAEQLGLDPGLVSNILSGKRKLSRRFLLGFIKEMKNEGY
jgi:predicted transcriptional regulator